MKIAENIYALCPSRGSIIYILALPEGLTVIDSGSEPSNAGIIISYVSQKLGMTPESIRNIFLTHWHGDHAGAADELRKMTGARIICHRDDAPLLSGSQNIDKCFHKPMPRKGLNSFWRGVCVLAYMTMKANTSPVKPDLLIDEGPAPFDDNWVVLSLPGHTPGSCGLWSESRRILFSGDTVVIIGKNVVKPFSFLIDNKAAFRRSWSKLSKLGRIEWILPGHFRPLRYDAKIYEMGEELL